MKKNLYNILLFSVLAMFFFTYCHSDFLPYATDAKDVKISADLGSNSITIASKSLTEMLKNQNNGKLDEADISYEIYYVESSSTTALSKEDILKGEKIVRTGDASDLTLDKLKPGTTYHVIVRAVHKNGSKAESSTTVFATKGSSASAPAAVDASKITVTPSASSLRVSWTAPDVTNAKKKDGSALSVAELSYEVYYVANTATTATTPATVLAGTKIAVAAGTVSADISALTADTQYHLLVRAINTTDTTKHSDSTVVLGKTTVAATASAPAAVDASKITVTPSASSLRVSWTAPDVTNAKKKDGSALSVAELSYEVYYVANTATTATTPATVLAGTKIAVAAGTVSADISALTADTQYHLLVRAINTTDTTKHSDSAVVLGKTTVAATATAPAAVDASKITVTPSASSLRVSWTAPDATNAKKKDGSALSVAELSYEVYYVANTATTATTPATVLAGTKIAVAAGTVSADISALTADTQYHLLVRAINTTDTTKHSDSTVVLGKTTVAATASAPGAVDASKITVTPSASSLRVSWTAPDVTNAKKKDGSALSVAELSYEVYYVANTATTATTPATVLAGTKIAVAAGTVSADISALTADTQYHLLVRAINTTDTAKYSDSTVVLGKTTVAATATAPAAVDASKITVTPSASSLRVSWTAPDVTNAKKKDGSALSVAELSYEVYYVANTATTATTPATVLAGTKIAVAAGTVSADISALTADTQYHLLVRAINTTDTAKYSDSTVVLGKTTVAATATAPAAVDASKITVTPSASSLRVSWTAPDVTNAKKKDGSALSVAELSYEVYYVANTATTATTPATVLAGTKIAVAAGTVSADISALTADTQYHLLVRAINTTDTTKHSDSAVVLGKTTVAATATAPAAVDASKITVTPSASSLRVSWTAPDVTNAKKKDGSALSVAELSYEVYYVANTATTATTPATVLAGTKIAVAAGTVSADISALTADTQYHLLVRAINTTDTAKYSDSTVVLGKTTVAATATAPAAVDASKITVTPSASSLRVSWTAPDVTNAKKKDGSALSVAELSYEVYYVANTATTATTPATVLAGTKIAVAAGTVSADISALTADTQYHLLVRAINTTDTTKHSDSAVVLGKTTVAATASFTVTSSNIVSGRMDLSIPTVSWQNPPPGTGSFIAMMYDHSIGMTHWLQDVSGNQATVVARGSYIPPDPPAGRTHSYHIVVFAISQTTPDINAMWGRLGSFYRSNRHQQGRITGRVSDSSDRNTVDILDIASISGTYTSTR